MPALLRCGFKELYFIEEPAVKSTIQILRKVGGRDEDAVEVLHLLQQDILHRVLHLIHRVLHVRHTHAEQGVRFIEEENRCLITLFANPAVTREDLLHVLLALADKLIAHLGHIYLHDIAPCFTGYLQNGLRLAGSRCTIEKARKTFAHSVRLQALLHLPELLLREQVLQFRNLSGGLGGVEQSLLADTFRINHALFGAFRRNRT